VVSGQEARPGHQLEARLVLVFILVRPKQNRIIPNLAGLGVAIFIGFSSLQALAGMTSGALNFSILRKDKLASRRGDRSRRSISARKDRKAQQALKLQCTLCDLLPSELLDLLLLILLCFKTMLQGLKSKLLRLPRSPLLNRTNISLRRIATPRRHKSLSPRFRVNLSQ